MKSADVSTFSRIKLREKASWRMRRMRLLGYFPSVCTIFPKKLFYFGTISESGYQSVRMMMNRSTFLLPERVLTLLRF